MMILTAFLFFNSFAFLFYGVSCLVSQKMKNEFFRFGLLPYHRIITGVSQLLGGVGLIVGYFVDIRIAFLSAAGLSILMLAGFIVRLKIKDPITETLPSFIFMITNLFLAYSLMVRF